jgi:hypothetical protein
MKIDGAGPIGETGPVKKQGTPRKVDGNTFADMLDNAVGGTTPAGQAGASSPLTPISKIPFLGNITSAGADSSAVTSRLDSLIDDLSMFQNSLANQNIDLAKLRPMIDSLLAHKDELAGMFRDMPEGELKNLVSSAISMVIDQSIQYDSATTLQ